MPYSQTYSGPDYPWCSLGERMWLSQQPLGQGHVVKHVVIGVSFWALPGCMGCSICLISISSYLELLVNHRTLSPLVVVVTVCVY